MSFWIPAVPAYVGPGAGFAFFSTALLFFLSAFIVLFALLLTPFQWFRRILTKIIPVKSVRYLIYAVVGIGMIWYSVTLTLGYFSGSEHPRFVLLGMDGLDPEIVKPMMKNGELPNFKRLSKRGSFDSLDVPNPPISPTSWASFITGSNPGRHGILGFIGRDPKSYAPELFTSVQPAKTFLNLPANLDLPGAFKLPVFPPKTVSQRQATPFWEMTSKAGVRTNVIRVPVTFPPETLNGKMLSGLGTPDLRGTQGSYSFWQEQAIQTADTSAGEIRRVRFFYDQAESVIVGPDNTLLDDPRPVEVPIDFRRSDTGVHMKIGESLNFFLPEQQWSDWKQINFPLGLGMSVSGIVRFHLNRVDPFQLYMTPIQIDPKDPVMAISHPESYSHHLAKRIGNFYTMGMAQDDKAWKEENISDETFLEQSYQGLRERRRILGLELRRERSGLIVGVFDTTDRIQHLMWRYRDPKHPLYDSEKAKQLSGAIPDVYRKMDEILGEVLDAVDNDVPVMVVSDHGFTSFRRQFHLNDWLRQEGYLTVKEDLQAEKGRFLRTEQNNFYPDWNRTEAYQMGLTGIYINEQGREEHGIVEPEQKWERARDIKQKLESYTDPKTGKHVFKRVYLSKNLYEGLYWQDGPDLILGYNKGYRTSWKSARGELHGGRIVTDNLNKWSGDHVIEASLVPGMIMSSVPLEKEDPHIMDVSATVLSYYGLEHPVGSDGKNLFEEKSP